MKKTNITHSQKKIISIVTAAVIVVAVVALNIGAAFIPEKYTLADMTASKLYTVSDQTKEFVSALEEDVTVSILDADGTNKQFEIFMERYADSGEHIKLEYVDTISDTEFLSSHGISVSGVNPYSIVVSSEKRSQLIDFYSMYYYSNENLGIEQMSYSQYANYYSLFSSSESYAEYLYELAYNSKLYFCGEKALTSTVEYVTLEYIPHSYFVTGHGEDSAEDGNFASLLSYMKYAYGVLDITQTDKIPADADCLIINAPTEDYTADEAEIILDYLGDGGRLLLITGEKNLGMENLMSIAEYYGATGSAELISQEQDTDEEYDAHTFTPVINTDHDVFANFPVDEYSVSISQATPITVSTSLRSALLVTPILTTSNEAYVGEDKTKGAYNIGVAMEEELDGETTRMVWYSSADTFNSEEATNENISLLVYAMTWMGESYDSSLGEISVPLSDDPLLTVSSSTAGWLAAFIIIIIPAVLITVGVIIYVRRRKA
ncbi:MAG: Gldg family protein [Clostridia bacterium]|nr:Gldg family protein [Clostridia bacterium]